MQIKLAFVDDESLQRKSVMKFLHEQTFQDSQYPELTFTFLVTTYSCFDEIKSADNLDLLLLDLNLGSYGASEESLKILKHIKSQFPDAVTVMYSGTEDENQIIEFMLHGADNFLSKNLIGAQLSAPLISTYMTAKKRREIYGERTFNIEGQTIIGETMRNIASRINEIVPYRSIRSILVYGETGTGKEVVADLVEKIASHSHGKQIPFFRFNCGAVADTLVESELFGAVKGAYTGAVDKTGYFEKADGGWIFLDEVSTLSVSAQNSLMRIIENNELTKVGSNKTKKIDVRVISATNENLDDLAEQGKFRKDLIQRLKGTVVELPPLRSRSADEVEELISYFARTNPDRPVEIDQTALKILKRYSWSEGNAREIRNTINSMIPMVGSSGVLYVDSIPRYLFNSIRNNNAPIHEIPIQQNADSFCINLTITPEKCSKNYIDQESFCALFNVLNQTKSIREIAKIYGVSHSTILEKIKKYNLKVNHND